MQENRQLLESIKYVRNIKQQVMKNMHFVFRPTKIVKEKNNFDTCVQVTFYKRNL